MADCATKLKISPLSEYDCLILLVTRDAKHTYVDGLSMQGYLYGAHV
jgi:hypothetical protein